MNRPQLTDDDYTPDDLDEFRTLMDTAAAEWERLLKDRTKNGQWQPASTAPLEQLAEAADLLTGLSRTLIEARTGIRGIDGRARRRFLERTVHQTPSA